MKDLLHHIKLVRPLNLVIIALTMYAMRYGIIYPMVIETNDLGLTLQLPHWEFILSVLVMVFLAAAGNIINDYFDVKVDRINKPDKILVGRVVKRRVAMVLHWLFNGFACTIGLFLAWRHDLMILAAIPFFMAGSLWYYSFLFKKQLLIGNVVVALMVAIVPLWAGLFDLKALALAYGDQISNLSQFMGSIWMWLLGFSFFAFLTTLIREAQKDLQDQKGDAAGRFRTLPIVYGRSIAKAYVLTLNALLVLLVIAIGFRIIPWGESPMTKVLLYALLLVIPSLLSWVITFKANDEDDYGRASLMSKLVMLGGILFTPVIWLLIREATLMG
jgi:4-hydroxybenzoate polyprenyltransferase